VGFTNAASDHPGERCRELTGLLFGDGSGALDIARHLTWAYAAHDLASREAGRGPESRPR
jgi:hypothetical protein